MIIFAYKIQSVLCNYVVWDNNEECFLFDISFTFVRDIFDPKYVLNPYRAGATDETSTDWPNLRLSCYLAQPGGDRKQQGSTKHEKN